MARRTNEIVGFVNFPIDSEEYRNTKEGGMFIRLVVADTGPSAWSACSAGHQTVLYDESLLGDDVHPDKPIYGPSPTVEEINAYHSTGSPTEEFHFPYLHAKRERTARQIYGSMGRYMSIPYLAALTLGSTGWSGYSDKDGYWRCTYEDLTEEGKALYNSIKALYGDNPLYLQTWLDT